MGWCRRKDGLYLPIRPYQEMSQQTGTHAQEPSNSWLDSEESRACWTVSLNKISQTPAVEVFFIQAWKIHFGNVWRHVYFYLIVLWLVHDFLYHFPKQIHWCPVATLLLCQILCLFLLSQSISSYSKHCHNIVSGTVWATIIRQMQKT